MALEIGICRVHIPPFYEKELSTRCFSFLCASVQTNTVDKTMSIVAARPHVESSPQSESALQRQTHPGSAFIQVSPYTDMPLNLASLTPVHADVAKRLQNLTPRGPSDHLDKPYSDAFNFKECFANVQYTTTLYVVVFRSTFAQHAVSTELFGRLHAQDHESYKEASTRIGGLLKYWFGVIDERRRNLATCIWVHRDHAKRANGLEQHQKAVELVRQVYEAWSMERYTLRIGGSKVELERI